MMPPRKDPSKRPGSKGPAGTPASGTPRPASKVPGPPGAKPASKPVAKPGTPLPAPAGKAPKMMRSGGSAGPLRRSAAPTHGSGTNPKVKIYAIGAVVGLVVIIGILFGVRSSRGNPDDVKKELQAKLAEIDKLPPEEIIKKHEELKKLLQNSAYNTGSCGSDYNQLVRAEEHARPLAERQEKADDDVGPFLLKYDQMKPSLDQAKAQSLLDQVSSLLNDYGLTPYREKLDAIKKELLDWLGSHTSTGSAADDWVPMKVEVDRLADANDFKRAFERAGEYGRKWAGQMSSTIQRQFDELKDSLSRKLKRFIEDTLREAKDLNDHGQTADARTKLQQAMEKVEGLEGYSELDGALRNLGGN